MLQKYVPFPPGNQAGIFIRACILCISCICFVFVSYALTLSMSGLSFMSIKICSVLLTKTFVICL